MTFTPEKLEANLFDLAAHEADTVRRLFMRRPPDDPIQPLGLAFVLGFRTALEVAMLQPETARLIITTLHERSQAHQDDPRNSTMNRNALTLLHMLECEEHGQ